MEGCRLRRPKAPIKGGSAPEEEEEEEEEEGTRCTYNVTLVSVSVTVVTVEQQEVLCILSVCL